MVIYKYNENACYSGSVVGKRHQKTYPTETPFDLMSIHF